MEDLLQESLAESKLKNIEQTCASIEMGLRKIVAVQEQMKDELQLLKRKMVDESPADTINGHKRAKANCETCGGSHRDFECSRLSSAERLAKAIQADICINCLRAHGGECRKRAQCNKCARKHNMLFHC